MGRPNPPPNPIQPPAHYGQKHQHYQHRQRQWLHPMASISSSYHQYQHQHPMHTRNQSPMELLDNALDRANFLKHPSQNSKNCSIAKQRNLSVQLPTWRDTHSSLRNLGILHQISRNRSHIWAMVIPWNGRKSRPMIYIRNQISTRIATTQTRRQHMLWPAILTSTETRPPQSRSS